MNQQQIKIRYGLILQGILAHALRKAGVDFSETPLYAQGFEKPDFLIPDAENPRLMIEVHQTEARDHFRMKTLRCVTAVTEAKVHFGDGLITVNVLFGNPHTEVPEANLRAMCGLFDHNILLIDHIASERLYAVQDSAMKLARTEGISTSDAADQIAIEHDQTVDAIAQVMTSELDVASTNPTLMPLWQMERERQISLSNPPPAGPPTYYKRNILRSLFFTDEQFEKLLSVEDSNDLSQEVRDQLLRCNLATITEEIWGDVLEIEASFADFLQDPEARHLRNLCQRSLNNNEAMHWFFEDIRSLERRVSMANEFLRLLSIGRKSIVSAVNENLRREKYADVNHFRCWVADFFGLFVSVSQNEFNRRMVQSDRDPENYQYPFNHITGKFERLLNNPEHFENYSQFCTDIFYEICNEKQIPTDPPQYNSLDLASKLLELRIDGSIKLQRFNPLYEVLRSVCIETGVSFVPIHAKSLIFDLSGGRGRLGKYNVLLLSKGDTTIIANALAPNENPQDKAKEWGARCQAMLYREFGDGIVRSDIDAALMILDGIWDNDDVARLYRSGWTHVAQLDEIENVLCSIFSIPTEEEIQIPEEPLALAAESDDEIKITEDS